MSDANETAQSALEWVRNELLALCEATESDASLCSIAERDHEHKPGAYARGRIHEAKGIRNAMAEVIRVKMQELS